MGDNAVKILPLRVLDANGSGSVSTLIQAYAYAVQHGAKVVNLSLGSGTALQAERDAIATFQTMPNVLCVAAGDNRDQLAPFSNYGATSVDLAAPGVSIASTWVGGGYSWASGTSMATPHVSGTAGLLWSAAPSSLPTDISSAIMGGVDASPAFAGKTVSGGRLNVLRSLRLVADVSVGEPAPAPAPGGGLGGSGADSGSSGTGGAGVNDAVPPRLSVRARRAQRVALLLRRGLAARVRCSERCTVRLVLRRRGRALTAPVHVRLEPGVSKGVRLRLSRAGARVLRHHRATALTLVARATDLAGNRRTLSMGMRTSR